MAAEDPLDLDRRLEAAQELEPFRAELRLRPAGRLEQPFLSLLVLDRLVAEIEGQEEVVRVPEDARAVELAQQVDTFERLRPALRDVAQADDQVDVVLLQSASAARKATALPCMSERNATRTPGSLRARRRPPAARRAAASGHVQPRRVRTSCAPAGLRLDARARRASPHRARGRAFVARLVHAGT